MLNMTLATPPKPERVAALAREIRAALGVLPPTVADPVCTMRTLGWRVECRRLQARNGGTRALLLPSDGGGFTCLVDPDPAPEERWLLDGRSPQVAVAVSEAAVRFRVGHELAHSLFYRLPATGQTPVRGVHFGSREEAFCDAFSAAFLVPADFAEDNPAAWVMRLARRKAIGLSIAVRALVALHPHSTIFAGTVDKLAGVARLSMSSGRFRVPPEADAIMKALRSGRPEVGGWLLAGRGNRFVLAVA